MQNQLSDFIQQARSKKIADEEIVKILLDQGWSFSQIGTNMSSSSSFNGLVPPKPTESIASNLGMWDSFQHILMFISLYVMSTAIALLLNYFVDKWLPGVTANSYYSYGDQIVLRRHCFQDILPALLFHSHFSHSSLLQQINAK